MSDRGFTFTPLINFEWKREGVLMGQYIPGMTYHCTHESVHDDLHAKCMEWLDAEMIKII